MGFSTEPQRLPFDLNDLRTIFYQLDLDHFEAAQNELRTHLEKAMSGTISPLDQALFDTKKNEKNAGDEYNSNRNLLAVLEVCESILKETQETKGLVGAVGQIAIDLKEEKEMQERLRLERNQQEMGMFLMTQFFQNPESAEKLIPAMQRLAEFGAAQRLQDEQNTKNL
jgi:hypothetical protein